MDQPARPPARPGESPDALAVLDHNAVRRWAVLLRSAFAARRAEIDALNVFPVPDGDTGTNLYLTIDGGIERLVSAAEGDGAGSVSGAGAVFAEWAGALLWSARGNSGVIFSQLARGMAEGADGADTIDGPTLVASMRQADERAWQAVTDPKEGTILSVSRAVAEAVDHLVDPSVLEVATTARDAARVALMRTPEQLDVLARAGVVDAGGAGLLLALECLERLCAGDDGRVVLGLGLPGRAGFARLTPGGNGSEAPQAPRPLITTDGPGRGAAWTDSPEYEVMYLLADSDEQAVDRLRARLVDLGDSVLVVGGSVPGSADAAHGVWNVHAHVDDAGAAIEAGIEAGRPHRIRVTRLLDDPAAHHHDMHPSAALEQAAETGHRPVVTRSGTAVVACAAGAGLAEIFGEAGALVINSGPGRRASTGAFIESIRTAHDSGAAGVVVLPNDGDTLLAAGAAARAAADDGIEVHVVAAKTAVQGIAALAVYEPSDPPAVNVLGMQAAASGTRHGAVTVANREALTSGGPCVPGDILGIVDGDIVIVGTTQADVADQVIGRLMSSGGELLTILSGAETPDGLVESITHTAMDIRRDVEVNIMHGGQPVYSVLLGVE